MHLFVEQVQQGGRLDAIDDLVDADFHNHTPNPAQSPGREGLRMATSAMHSAFSGFTVELMHCIGEGDLVASHKIFRGTHR